MNSLASCLSHTRRPVHRQLCQPRLQDVLPRVGRAHLLLHRWVGAWWAGGPAVRNTPCFLCCCTEKNLHRTPAFTLPLGCATRRRSGRPAGRPLHPPQRAHYAVQAQAHPLQVRGNGRGGRRGGAGCSCLQQRRTLQPAACGGTFRPSLAPPAYASAALDDCLSAGII